MNFKLDYPMWKHHRTGWKHVYPELAKLTVQQNVTFNGHLDVYFSEGKFFSEPWIGVLHNVPNHFGMIGRYKSFFCLDEILRTEQWKKSEKWCKGIFVLSPYLYNYLKEIICLPLDCLYLPSESDCDLFSFDKFIEKNKNIIMIGSWLRKIQSIFELDIGYNKCLLKTGHKFEQEDLNIVIKKLGCKYNGVQILDRKTDAEYDKILQSSIVFLDLYDVAANNTILDCIVRNTPVLVNKLVGAIDYLVEDYPFYFRDLKEAAHKAQDLDLIFKTNLYLKSLPIKEKLTMEHFIYSFKNSFIYKKLNRKLFI